MKNIILKTTLTLALTTVLTHAECKIFTSPATDFSTLKGSSALSLSIANVYYEKNKNGKRKMKIKLGGEAFLEFDEKARAYLQKECKKNGYSVIYNYQIRSTVTERWFNFAATYDYK